MTHLLAAGLASLGFAVSASVGVFLIWYALAQTVVESHLLHFTPIYGQWDFVNGSYERHERQDDE